MSCRRGDSGSYPYNRSFHIPTNTTRRRCMSRRNSDKHFGPSHHPNIIDIESSESHDTESSNREVRHKKMCNKKLILTTTVGYILEHILRYYIKI